MALAAGPSKGFFGGRLMLTSPALKRECVGRDTGDNYANKTISMITICARYNWMMK